MENYESTLRELLRAVSVSSSLSLGPFEQNWTDEDFLNKLKDTRWYLIDELSASKNVAHNMLRFLLTGKTGTGLVQDIMHQFICAMEWFDDGFGSSCHVVKDLMVHLGSTPHVFSTPTSLSKKDLVNEFKNRLDFPHTETSTSNANSKLGLSIHGLINIHYDEAVKMVEQYYDLIEIYYSLNKRHQPMSGEIKRSISFVRSLYVLVLILLRCRAKDQGTVMGYIRNGSYMRIARRLVNSPGDVLFSINPKSAELSSFLLFLSSSTGLESTYYVLLGIYCGLREGISKPHIVNFDGEIPQKIINPLQVSNTHRYSSLTELLKSGCMMHIKYKGMYPIRNIEELSHLSSKSITDILKILCTTDTVGHCQRIGRIYEKYNPRWSKCEGVIYYHPAETTWKYSKIFSDFVLPELSSKNNVQLIYRLVSILASHKKIEMPTIMCLKGYIVKENDIEYIQNISRKLFPHS